MDEWLRAWRRREDAAEGETEGAMENCLLCPYFSLWMPAPLPVWVSGCLVAWLTSSMGACVRVRAVGRHNASGKGEGESGL